MQFIRDDLVNKHYILGVKAGDLEGGEEMPVAEPKPVEELPVATKQTPKQKKCTMHQSKSQNKNQQHVPVLVNEVLQYLDGSSRPPI